MSDTNHRLLLPKVCIELVVGICGLGNLRRHIEAKLCTCRTYRGQPWRKMTDVELAAEKINVFLSKICENDVSGCWEWSGGRNLPPGLPYGRFKYCRREYKAHNFSYALFNGPIPRGLLVCHKCDNPPCVNPTHLFSGTHSDNIQDCHRKGRNSNKLEHLKNRFGERNGNSKLTECDVRWIRENYDCGECGSLSSKFGVSKAMIYAIVNRKSWTHL